MVLRLQKTLDNLLPETIRMVEDYSELDLSSREIEVKVAGRESIGF